MTIPNNKELLKLADRVEAAEGADPLGRLDWEIWIAVNEPDAKLEGNGSDRLWQVRLGGSPLGGGKIIHWGRAPTYTASLDSAMTLVPEGWRVVRIGEEYGSDEPPWRAALVEREGPFGRVGKHSNAATPALALCAAALRAIAAQGDR